MKHRGRISIARRTIAASATTAACKLLLASAAHAAGSGMPWEAPLQRILESIEGQEQA